MKIQSAYAAVKNKLNTFIGTNEKQVINAQLGIVSYSLIIKGCQRIDESVIYPAVLKRYPRAGKFYVIPSRLSYGVFFKSMQALSLASFACYAYDTAKQQQQPLKLENKGEE